MRTLIAALGAGLMCPTLALAQPLPLPPPVPRVIESKCATAEHRQFDFWVGSWDVYRTGTLELVARSTIEKLYGDCAIRENWAPFSQIDGGSLSIYLPDEKLWKQTWVDAENSRVEYSGAFSGGKMVMTGSWKTRPGAASRSRTSRMTFYPESGTVRQIGEYSLDNGKTWVPEYDFTYRPHKPS